MVGDSAGIGITTCSGSPLARRVAVVDDTHRAARTRETADALGARARVERIVVIIGVIRQVEVLIVASTRARCAHARAIDRRIACGAPRRPSRAVRARGVAVCGGRSRRTVGGRRTRGFFLCPREGGLREAIGATTASRADGKTVDAV